MREGACAPAEVAERLHDGSRGFQPTANRASEVRRVATLETCATPKAFSRRYATKIHFEIKPWTEVHGYRHVLATRGNYRDEH
jgi:hypothetical protein